MPTPSLPQSLSRRHFLGSCGVGLGQAALSQLLPASREKPFPLRAPHHKPRAKAVIHLFMAGAPSQLDLFDEKPVLSRLEGKPLPASIIGNQRYAFIQKDAGVLGPRFPFQPYGDSGMPLGQPMRELGKVVDKLCFIKSMHTDQFNHAPAQLLMNTGFGQPGRPCLGSWTLYGLGAETEDLPAFVVLSTGSGLSGGSALWSSGFMPTVYTGVRFRNGKQPILNAATPKGFSPEAQADAYELIAKLNAERSTAVADPEIQTRIAAFEMAARLQVSAPELMNLREEGQDTLDLYGCHPDKPSFARACLVARRLIERGVRFVNIFHEGWDAHSDVRGNSLRNSRATARASAALVADLDRRGMLDDTLVVWGGEFGRTPMVETNPALGRKLGRDHHPQAYTMWMAGGGARPGYTHGATDDFGFHITENPVHVHDLQATILHLLGFDHERLTFHTGGRDYRLTDVHGKVIPELIR